MAHLQLEESVAAYAHAVGLKPEHVDLGDLENARKHV
jgi:hypothetical protein